LTGETWAQYTRTTSEAVRQIDVAPGRTLDDTIGSTLAHLSAPITLRNEVIGNLRLEDPDRVWTPDDQALLETIANELAIAAENARLIEQTEQRAQREARLNQIAQQLRQTTDIKSILQTAAEQLSLALDTSHAQAQLGTAKEVAHRPNGDQARRTE
jgi:GAF domain-containing protein